MNKIEALQLLSIWERESDQPMFNKMIVLINEMFPQLTPNVIAQISIGQRDILLFEIRRYLFGSIFHNVINCPQCSEIVEWKMNMRDLNLPDISLEKLEEKYMLKIDDLTVRFRLLNSQDITQAISNDKRSRNDYQFITKCILDVKRKNKKFINYKLPIKILHKVVKEMEKKDPYADIRLNLSCPVCLFKWIARFDIFSYLWTEIDIWAKHLLQDVFILASAFGWSESEILELSVDRRQLYIGMVT